MIHYFKLVSEGYTFGCSETYLRQEAPKGELGSQVLSGIIKPDRVKIRSPDYYNLQALNIISSCHYLADLIAVLGSADFVLGSVDRIPTNTALTLDFLLTIFNTLMSNRNRAV